MKNYEEGIKKWDFIGWKENIGKIKIFEDHVLLSLHSTSPLGGEEMKSEIQYCYCERDKSSVGGHQSIPHSPKDVTSWESRGHSRRIAWV